MMRITTTTRGNHRTTLAIEGWIAGVHAALLATECTRRLENGERLVLDLGSVPYVDALGATTLSRLLARGVEVAGCSAFLQESIARSEP